MTEIPMTETNTDTQRLIGFRTFGILEHSSFGFVSYFVFRASGLISFQLPRMDRLLNALVLVLKTISLLPSF